MKGQQTLDTNNSEYNALSFFVEQMLNSINTAEPVRVTAVSAPVGVNPVGFVDVLPMVNLVDGEGRGHEQSTLYRLPYLRIQGGKNAFICDPQPGDMGLAVYAMRDTETVKETRGAVPGNPGSARALSKGDGFYLGGFLNAAPERYIMVDDTGITLDDGAGGKLELKGGKLTIAAPAGIQTSSPFNHNDTPDFVMGSGGATGTVNGNLQVNGQVSSTQDQIAGGISQIHHTHTGVQPGSGNTGEPR